MATKSYMCTSSIHSFMHFVEHLLCARWFFQAQNKTDNNPTVVGLGGNRGGNGIKKENHSLSDGIEC